MRTTFLIWMTLAVAARSCGQSWERLGPEGGMVLSLGVDSAGTVYLGTSDGHVFASEDRAARWELRGRVGPRTDAVVAALAADPRIPGKVFAAVWFREAGAGGGVFRSDDGGRTWLLAGLPGEAVRALEFSASRPGTIIAGTRSGVFRSRDEGENWERTTPKDWVVNGVAVLPARGSEVARVLLGTEAQGVLASEDAGKNFTSANHGFTHPWATRAMRSTYWLSSSGTGWNWKKAVMPEKAGARYRRPLSVAQNPAAGQPTGSNGYTAARGAGSRAWPTALSGTTTSRARPGIAGN
ncbi:MAG TPA: hypothetical protein VNO13_02175 [Candidatus Udaeobacter sp.]|nr:hypothetical protein [Candidatus Udaeobacter sp.]